MNSKVEYMDLFWTVSIPCAAVANVLAIWIFARLKTLGFERRWWKQQDFFLYATYWRLAPKQGWSRLPLIAGAALFAVAVVVAIISFRHFIR
jgi:hypothetical protein